jgi:septal ring factor EnvC (AmiA/AmiB activator)
MRKDTDNTILKELRQVLSLEDSILGSLSPETAEESPNIIRSAKKDDKKPASNQTARSSELLLSIITDQVRAKFLWQGAAVFMAILVVILSVLCFNFYNSRENLAEITAEMKPLQKKLTETEAEIAKVKANATIAGSELQRSQSELNSSKAEVKKLQDQLADVTRRFETLQSRNAEAAKLLNGRLQRLSSQSEAPPKH